MRLFSDSFLTTFVGLFPWAPLCAGKPNTFSGQVQIKQRGYDTPPPTISRREPGHQTCLDDADVIAAVTGIAKNQSRH